MTIGKAILYFTAQWCGPCKMMVPIIEEFSKDKKFFKIDVDENKDLVDKYKIKSIPTFIEVNDGIEIKRLTGKQDLMSLQKTFN